MKRDTNAVNNGIGWLTGPPFDIDNASGVDSYERSLATMQTNVRSTIKSMKRHGTTGASYACLRQNTPTTGLTCSVLEYHRIFRIVADELAALLNFSVYE